MGKVHRIFQKQRVTWLHSKEIHNFSAQGNTPAVIWSDIVGKHQKTVAQLGISGKVVMNMNKLLASD